MYTGVPDTDYALDILVLFSQEGILNAHGCTSGASYTNSDRGVAYTDNLIGRANVFKTERG